MPRKCRNELIEAHRKETTNGITDDFKTWIAHRSVGDIPKAELPPEAITWADDFAEYLSNKGNTETDKELKRYDNQRKPLTTTQLRKFFGVLKSIQANGYDNSTDQFRMLLPQLAYAVGRDKKKSKIVDFYDAISPLLKSDVVNNKDSFKNLCNLIEAIVAYHKFYKPD